MYLANTTPLSANALAEFERVVQQTADTVVITGREGIIQYVNPAFEELTGYTAVEAVGQTPALLKSGWHDADFIRDLWQTILRGDVFRAEFANRRKDGRIYYQLETISPICDEAGEITHFVSTGRDITGRKEREEELRRRNDELVAISAISVHINQATSLKELCDAALDQAAACFAADGAECYLLNQTGQIAFFGQRGLSAEFVAKRHLDNNRVCDLNIVTEAIKLRQPIAVTDLQPNHPCNCAVLAAAHGYQSGLFIPLVGREGALGTLVLYSREQRVYVEREIALAATIGQQMGLAVERMQLFTVEQNLRRLTQALQQAGTAVSATLDLSEVLKRILTELGCVIPCDSASVILLEEDDMLRVAAGQNLPDNVIDKMRFSSESSLPQQLRQTGQPLILVDAQRDARFENWADTTYIHGWMGLPLMARGQFIGYITVDSQTPGVYTQAQAELAMSFAAQAALAVENAQLHQNLQRQIEIMGETRERLVQSEKLAAIGELVAGVAHELNNPLSSVILYAQLIQRRNGELTPRLLEDLDVIVAQAHRASGIVRGLLDFARQRPPARKMSQIADVINSALNLVAYDLRNNNIFWETQFLPDLPLTMADPHQLQQVFVNLLSNTCQAIGATQREGHLSIRLETGASIFMGEASSGRPVIRAILQDDGPGIPPHLLTRIFDPFFTTKPPGEGTGLGLSVCHGIVNEHGGHIWATSVAGRGATFYVEIPLVAERKPAVVAPPTVSPPAPPPMDDDLHRSLRRILIIDDEPSLRQIIARSLKRENFDVDAVSNGETGLALLNRGNYDLILCDVRMPGLSGPDFYREVVELHPTMLGRIVFITGDTISPATRRFLEETKARWLTKPFELTDLMALVQNWSGERRPF
jgi:PAS domain S-box-containing protein